MTFDCRRLKPTHSVGREQSSLKRTGHWHLAFGIGPLFLTFVPHLRPRLMVYWDKRNLIGEP